MPLGANFNSYGNRVWFDANRDHLQNYQADQPLEPGIKDVVVNLYPTDAQGRLTQPVAVAASTTTDDQGAYFLRQLPAGYYRPEFLLPNSVITFTPSQGFVGGDYTIDSNYDASANSSELPAPPAGYTRALGDYFKVEEMAADHSIDLGAWGDVFDLVITKAMAAASVLPNNPFTYRLEKVLADGAGNLSVDPSFTPVDFTLEDNQSRLFATIPLGLYRLKETLPPLYQITAITNATALTPLTGEVLFSINGELDNPNLSFGKLEVTIDHDLRALGDLSLTLTGGENRWFNFERSATLSATASEQPLSRVAYQLNASFAAGTCSGGNELAINPASAYSLTLTQIGRASCRERV